MRWLAIALLLASCRVPLSGKYTGAPPRARQEVRVLLDGDAEARELTARAFAADGRVTVAFGDAGKQCERARGFDYVAVVGRSAEYDYDFVCTKYELSLSKNDKCLDGRVENEVSTAFYSLRVLDARTCEPVGPFERDVRALVSGPAETSKPAALAELDAKLPKALERLFPDQLFVGDGQADAGKLYALFDKGGNWRGFMRGDREPVTCCADAEPGDPLVERGGPIMLELVVGAAVARLDEAEVGVTTRISGYPIAGGTMFGASMDFVGGDDVGMLTGGLEAGWVFRPGPCWEVTPFASVGISERFVVGGEDPELALQLGAFVRGTRSLGRSYWSVDAGWTHGLGADLSGPMLRVTAGLQ